MAAADKVAGVPRRVGAGIINKSPVPGKRKNNWRELGKLKSRGVCHRIRRVQSLSAMTRPEAEKEFFTLSRHVYMWADPTPQHMTPYQHAILRRQSALFSYLYNNKPSPPSNWLPPPRDVEETVENWYRNHFPATWRERMNANLGNLPPLPEEGEGV